MSFCFVCLFVCFADFSRRHLHCDISSELGKAHSSLLVYSRITSLLRLKDKQKYSVWFIVVGCSFLDLSIKEKKSMERQLKEREDQLLPIYQQVSGHMCCAEPSRAEPPVLCSTLLGSARLSSALLGSARLGSARLGSARLWYRIPTNYLFFLTDVYCTFFLQLSIEFADLHDTPGRMQEKGVISVSSLLFIVYCNITDPCYICFSIHYFFTIVEVRSSL